MKKKSDISNNIAIQEHVSLAAYSTFKIGGQARYFVEVTSSDEIVAAIEWAKGKGIQYRIMAGGSNIVFPDEGIEGLVIRISGGSLAVSGITLTADTGVVLMEAVTASINAGLAGLETLSGIPGTIGGAVVGNAGAYGRQIGDVIEKVEIWDGEKRRWLTQAACSFSYRHSVFKEQAYLVLQIIVRLVEGNKNVLKAESIEIIAKREKKYRPGLACPGSFFKNIVASTVSPEVLLKIDQSKIIAGKIPTGYLLQEVGAPGMKVGGIRVADYHGNLLINSGEGTAKDVKELASILKEKVRLRFGITLEEEVRYF